MAKKTTATAQMERKSFTGMELKADKPGSFTARIATLNVIDKDGDVTVPGAFPAGKTILISAYQHGSWSGGLPVGKGIVRESGDEVLVDGQFNLNSDTGKEHYETVKFAPELQEWSYGFIVTDAETDQPEFNGDSVRRILKGLDVFEASPVMRGAGVGTACLNIKQDKQPACHGLTYNEELEAAHAAVSNLLVRTRSLAGLRAKEGRTLSKASRERLEALAKATAELSGEVKALPTPPDPPPDTSAVEKLKTVFLRKNFEIMEVLNK